MRAGEALRIAWHEGITVVRDADDLVLESFLGAVRLRRVPNGVAEALSWLGQRPFSVDELSDRVLATDGPEQLHRLYFHVNELASRGLLRHSVHMDGAPLATLEAVSPYHRFERFDTGGDFVLSRFALLRREGERLLLESPLGHARVILHDARGAAFVSKTMNATDDTAADLLLLLRNARTVVRAGEEESDPVLAQWSFHDLYFHTRSRFGRHTNPFGATFRHAGAIAPPPAVKEPPRGDRIELPRFAVRDDAIERRRTIYAYDDAHPITFAQLAEFLHRVARVRETFEVPVPDREDVRIPVSSRPYPSGGKSYELEIYLAVASCQGLGPGFYHYDPLGHRLTRIRERDAAVDALLQYATVAAPNIRQPQVMITLAARFQRVSWKYDAIAYAATLKHVGVLYQSMYLVATEMGLAPCALGSGDSDLFAAAAGTDYLVETSVGEFLLGSAAP